MKYVPNAVTRTAARTVLKTQKNAPGILFVAGVVGAVAATVLACKATLRLEEEVLEPLEHGDTREAIGSAVKLYGPAVIVGSLSIAALTGSHNLLNKRNAALTAAYKGIEKAYDKYREKVREELGEDKERELYYDAVKTEKIDPVTGKTSKVKEMLPSERSVYARFFDELNRNWSPKAEYNRAFIQAQQNYANDMLKARGHLFLNEVYEMLGLDHSQAGAVVGWVISKDGDNYVDFGIFDRTSESAREFVNGHWDAVLLDFNVDGVIYDKI